MIVYDDGDRFHVYEDHGWFYPMQYSKEMEDMVFWIDKDGFEKRFDSLDKAVDFLAGK